MPLSTVKATIIGFSRDDCKKCHGRGRLGFDRKFSDLVHVIPCSCVEFMDLETVQKSWEAEHKSSMAPREVVESSEHASHSK